MVEVDLWDLDLVIKHLQKLMLVRIIKVDYLQSQLVVDFRIYYLWELPNQGILLHQKFNFEVDRLRGC